MKRGELWWAALPEPMGRRPVLVVQSNPFNDSRIASVVVALVTSNLALEAAPGNVRLPRGEAGAPKACIVNVSQLYTLDRTRLVERLGLVSPAVRQRVDAGLRLVLALPLGAAGAGLMEAAAEYAVQGRPAVLRKPHLRGASPTRPIPRRSSTSSSPKTWRSARS